MRHSTQRMLRTLAAGFLLIALAGCAHDPWYGYYGSDDYYTVDEVAYGAGAYHGGGGYYYDTRADYYYDPFWYLGPSVSLYYSYQPSYYRPVSYFPFVSDYYWHYPSRYRGWGLAWYRPYDRYGYHRDHHHYGYHDPYDYDRRDRNHRYRYDHRDHRRGNSARREVLRINRNDRRAHIPVERADRRNLDRRQRPKIDDRAYPSPRPERSANPVDRHGQDAADRRHGRDDAPRHTITTTRRDRSAAPSRSQPLPQRVEATRWQSPQRDDRARPTRSSSRAPVISRDRRSRDAEPAPRVRSRPLPQPSRSSAPAAGRSEGRSGSDASGGRRSGSARSTLQRLRDDSGDGRRDDGRRRDPR